MSIHTHSVIVVVWSANAHSRPANRSFRWLTVLHPVSFHSIQSGNPPRVKTAAHLMQDFCYRYKDNLSAGVIVAGWDPVDGGSVYSVPAGGMSIQVPFSIGGSGSLFIGKLVTVVTFERKTLHDSTVWTHPCVPMDNENFVISTHLAKPHCSQSLAFLCSVFSSTGDAATLTMLPLVSRTNFPIVDHPPSCPC